MAQEGRSTPRRSGDPGPLVIPDGGKMNREKAIEEVNRSRTAPTPPVGPPPTLWKEPTPWFALACLAGSLGLLLLMGVELYLSWRPIG